MARTPHIDIMRSPLGRARGLGSASAGAHHWWMLRLTSLALVPLSLWFLCAMVGLIGATRDDVVSWMAGPLPIVLMMVPGVEAMVISPAADPSFRPPISVTSKRREHPAGAASDSAHCAVMMRDWPLPTMDV